MGVVHEPATYQTLSSSLADELGPIELLVSSPEKLSAA